MKELFLKSYFSMCFQLWKPASVGCVDHFFFVTPESMPWDYYLKQGVKKVEFDWNSPSEREFVSCHFGLLNTLITA